MNHPWITLRAATFLDGVHVLAWIVAPETRGRGVANRMAAELASQFRGPLKA
jgi:hypothetical protein